MHFVEGGPSDKGYAADGGCPACRQRSAMLAFERVPDLQWCHGERSPSHGGPVLYFARLRQCSNPACRAVVVFYSTTEVDGWSQPSEVVTFDADLLSASAMGIVEEAVKCHAAGRYTASALLVRRILEQLCNRMSTGDGALNSSIAALNSLIDRSEDAIGDSSDRRIVINDDDEIPVVDRDAVSPEEVTLALALAKQLLKAVYQYGTFRTRLLSLNTAPGMG